MPESVYKVVELVGSSEIGWEDAGGCIEEPERPEDL